MKEGGTSLKEGDTSLKEGDTSLKEGDTSLKEGDTSLKEGDTSLKDEFIIFKVGLLKVYFDIFSTDCHVAGEGNEGEADID